MRARRAAVAMAMAVGMGLVWPAAAQAAPSCPAGKVCSWSGPGFVGSYGWINPPTGCDTTSYGAITDRRSAVNNGPGPVIFWERFVRRADGSLGCGGRAAFVPRGGAVADFGFTAVAVAPAGA